jgi:hypothetical protein
MLVDGTPERWWHADEDEVFWLEITEREDVGETFGSLFPFRLER